MTKKIILLSAKIVIMVLLLTACGGGSKTSSSKFVGDTIRLNYAENITIIDFKDYKKIELQNPWNKGKILHTYILIDKDKEIPTDLPQGTIVRTPISKSIVYSAVHCGVFNEIGALKNIAGICDLKYIKLKQIKDGCKNGSITNVGDGMSPDIEKIIDLHPDAILLSPFENSGGYGKVEKINVPIIECADYMETSALGRAEWIKFYGMLTGKEKQANAIFSQVERDYKELAKIASSLRNKPTVMCELKSGTAWYVPGGKSTISGLYKDAGGNYIFRDNNRSGSIPLSFETVFDKAQNADIWLIKYNRDNEMTYSELSKDYSPYTGFKAFKEKNIFSCNTGKVAFYEESPFHPNILLKDLIKIFHPELLKDYKLKYFTNLAE